MIRLNYSRMIGEPPRLDWTPLIDLVFTLIIFFAVSTTLFFHEYGMKLQLPVAETASKQNQKGFLISVTPDQKIRLNETEITLADLKIAVSQALASDPTLSILLNADGQVPYAFVVTVLDTVRASGGTDIILQARKPSEPAT